MTHHPRFGVLPLAPGDWCQRYVIFDSWTCRITDGVYFARDLALEVAAFHEERGAPAEHGTPDAGALGLLFPALADTRR
jgi:hypothetical protein